MRLHDPLGWAIPPVRLGLSGRNSGKTPERPRKRSQSVSWNSRREYGWDAPNPIIQGIWGFQSISRIISPQYAWGRFFFQKWFRRGPLRAGHGIPSGTGGISDWCAPYCLQGKSVWTNAAESLPKVSPRLVLVHGWRFPDSKVLETGIGGVKSPKIRGGVKILKFWGSRNLTLFYRDSIENPQFGGQKSKLSKENFRGEFPPPLAFGTFWPPLSWSPKVIICPEGQ